MVNLHDGFFSTLDRGARFFSAVLLPTLLALLSLLSLWLWPNQYPASTHQSLAFQHAHAPEGQWSPEQALEHLRTPPQVMHWDSRLSEAPLWVLLQAPNNSATNRQIIEFPSRHATQIECWDADSLRSIGRGNRTQQTGGLRLEGASFVLSSDAYVASNRLLCQTSFLGPARFTARVWPELEFDARVHEFHRNSGLLDGGLLVLAIFVLIAGLINRDTHYLLFSAWLFINLRIAALSAGWDHQWLGHTIPFDWLVHMRPLTLALFAFTTLALFKDLFAATLRQIRHAWAIDLLLLASLLLLPLSLLLPYRTFLPVIWSATGIGVGVLVYFLGFILLKTRSRVAFWFACSIAIALLASAYEVAAASLGLKGWIGTVNNVTAVLLASLLASLAIAEQMRSQQQQRMQVQQELEHTYEVIPVGMFVLDLQGHFQNANPALLKLLGNQKLEPESSTWRSHFGDAAWHNLLTQLRAGHDGRAIELEWTAPIPGQTDKRHYLVKATLVNDRIEGVLQDVSDKARAAEHFQLLAEHDPLTAALNRHGLDTALQRALEQRAQGKPMALGYLDLDRFKLINDLYGHRTGDDILHQVGQRILETLQPRMQLGRIGGDEFLLILPDTPFPLAQEVARRIVDRIGTEPYQVGDHAFHVRASVGLIEVAADTQTKDAISAADRACTQAKGSPDGLAAYGLDSPLFQDHEAELQLVERLSTDQPTEGLFLEMQPIMSLRSPHASLNFEVLLRMRDRNGSLIPTNRLIQAGEHAGRMGTIDRWVLTQTIDWLHLHAEQLKQNQFVCVNLNGSSLNDEKFMDDVFDLLGRNPTIAHRLCLEITESIALHDLGNTRRFIDQVRSCGAKVALDDFGAGYTSFSYLKDLPADLLKIDGQFIVNMTHHPANVAIVEAIVSLAQNLGMKTIAEWAEDCETVETLAEIGVDYVQGYAVARPQPPEKLLQVRSAVDFIQDEDLRRYLQPMAIDEDLGNVDLVLGDTTRLQPRG